jgi:hypothetical protein
VNDTTECKEVIGTTTKSEDSNVVVNAEASENSANNVKEDNTDYTPNELHLMTTDASDKSDGDKKTSVTKFIGDFLVAMIPSPTNLADLFSEKTVSVEMRECNVWSLDI